MTYGDYPNFDNVKKILIVKMRHLGDVLLSTPIYTILKKRFPHLSIDALVYEESKILLEGHSAINEIYTRKRKDKKRFFLKNFINECFFLRMLKKNNYDLILNLTEGDRGAIISRYCRPLYRVGVESRHKIYTHTIKQCKNPRHQVERDLDGVRVMGIFPSVQERKLHLFLPEASYEKTKNIKEYFLFCPFSRWKFKGLSMEKMREILSFLVNNNQKIVIAGSSDPIEIKMSEELVLGFSEDAVVNLVGKLDIKELGALMEKSKGVICVDSLALHLSSCFKKRVIAFFGPTSELKWGPWQNPNAIVIVKALSCRPCSMDGCGGSKYSDCLERIDLRKVFSHLEEWIKNPKEDRALRVLR